MHPGRFAWTPQVKFSEILISLAETGRRCICYHTWTLFLFTKSDMKTILLPIVSFTVMNGATPLMRAVFTLLWTWLHLLQFCVSNQRSSSIEDAHNKPWRPIPSARISPRQTHLLRLLLVPLCIVFSSVFGTMTVSAIFALLTFAHNDTPLGHSNWVTRNFLVAAGYATLDVGAAIVAHSQDQRILCDVVRTPLLNAAMIFTTVHAQDFADERGDRMKGRRTIPIVMPKVGRLSMAVGLMIWSTILTHQYALPVQVAFVLISLGAYTGGRYYYARSPSADRHSYFLYNIWLSLARITALFRK
ncbi:hypothetical protein BDZ89DRAFT_1021131 [Hymenopellis radicata]|nr:hypothetical protein BDZ89DRAFT_1021131 [Hymenopellis radicata]